jgi:predicted nucleic acid-binding protein
MRVGGIDLPLAIDASIVAAWAIQDESDDVTDQLLVRTAEEGAVSPTLLWYEVRNMLLLAERRKRITPRESDEFIVRIQKLSIEMDEPVDSRQVMRMARRHMLTGYDATYLLTALHRHLPLATLDKKLVAAAKAEGLEVLPT